MQQCAIGLSSCRIKSLETVGFLYNIAWALVEMDDVSLLGQLEDYA